MIASLRSTSWNLTAWPMSYPLAMQPVASRARASSNTPSLEPRMPHGLDAV